MLIGRIGIILEQMNCEEKKDKTVSFHTTNKESMITHRKQSEM